MSEATGCLAVILAVYCTNKESALMPTPTPLQLKVMSGYPSVHAAESTTLQPPASITQGATSTTTVSVSWSQVSGTTGYYVSYQRQVLGTPPVVTPQYERIVGGDNTSVTLSDLEPGTTYRIRVWSTDETSVSSEAGAMDVATVESGEFYTRACIKMQAASLECI